MTRKAHPVYKTPTAERKIIEIIKWSAKKWGEKTARDYISNIEKVINSVASGELPCQKNPEFSTRFSYCKAKRHYIFFEHKDDKLIVATIFHTSMKIKDRITEETLSTNHEIDDL
jgi:plasmid stabilization system protein ParE